MGSYDPLPQKFSSTINLLSGYAVENYQHEIVLKHIDVTHYLSAEVYLRFIIASTVEIWDHNIGDYGGS